MDLAKAVLARLLASPAVTDVVASRIHWLRRPQGGALPALVLSQVSRVSEGDTLDDEGPLWSSRIQIDCFADGATGFSTSRALARAAKATLVEPGDVNGLDLFGADSDGPTDFTEDTASGPLFRASIDLTIRHGEES